MDVAQDLPKARTKSHIGRNIPIFGKALIVAAVSLALLPLERIFVRLLDSGIRFFFFIGPTP
jgi:hypothetical protein